MTEVSHKGKDLGVISLRRVAFVVSRATYVTGVVGEFASPPVVRLSELDARDCVRLVAGVDARGVVPGWVWQDPSS